MSALNRVVRVAGALILCASGVMPQSACSSGRPVGAPTPSKAPGAHAAGQPAPEVSGNPPSAGQPAAVRAGPLHYIANTGDNLEPVIALGYNLFDTGPNPATVNALPAGGRALVWLGSLDNENCIPDYSWSRFTAAVDGLTGNPAVYGYFLSDEPHPGVCANAVADIRQRADYIHAHDPTHRSFTVVLDGTNQCGGNYGCEYSALRPANSHVDLIGLDPYPCNTGNLNGGCTYSKIDDAVRRAEASGIPRSAMVPVFQTFGQTCARSNYYRMPSETELRTMLAHWTALLPKPAFDYTYTWGRQGTSCPALVDATDLQAVVRVHNDS